MGELNLVSGADATPADRIEDQVSERAVQEIPAELRGDLIAIYHSGVEVKSAYDRAEQHLQEVPAWNVISRFFAKRKVARTKAELAKNDERIAWLSSQLVTVPSGSAEA